MERVHARPARYTSRYPKKSRSRTAPPAPAAGSLLERHGIEISGSPTAEFSEILTEGALYFIQKLSRQFGGRREALLQRRMKVQARIDNGAFPVFPPETSHLRNADWKIAPVPPDLQDRRVEITGPAADAKMVINAFNSGANVYMADFEDAQSPTWENTVRGQSHLYHAIRGTLVYRSPEGKVYSLDEKRATLMVRPRGWHLIEKHVLIDGRPVSASLLDFGLFLFHNAAALLERRTAPYFYLPKIETYLEARLWNDVFVFAESELKLSPGTIKATVLIETILAAFEMDEILYELRDHSAGLNCGRWDYIFSFIKKFRAFPRFVLPDRAEVTMDKAFLRAYVDLLIQTCHRRGAHAMGGMSAFIPIKGDEEANSRALARVREDKEREVRAGHDGTWVAHPGLVQTARAVFDELLQGPNQLSRLRDDVQITPEALLEVPQGQITERGLRTNIDVGIRYLEAWLRGTGAVPLYNLMEDAATAEICRAQVWQWIHHRALLSDGRSVTPELVRRLVAEEFDGIPSPPGRSGPETYELARDLFEQLVLEQEFVEFLTIPAYENIH